MNIFGYSIVSIKFIYVTSVQGHRVYQSTRVCKKVLKYGRVPFQHLNFIKYVFFVLQWFIVYLVYLKSV